MTKKDLLDKIKDLPDDTLIEVYDDRPYVLSIFNYPKDWEIKTSNKIMGRNVITIQIN